MSNYSNRNSKMPDTSLQPRSSFTSRQISACIGLILLIVALCTLGYYALDARRNRDLDAAIASADERRLAAQAAIERVTARETELDTRERTLDGRQTALDTAEASLAQRETDLATARFQLDNDKTNFAAHQNRVYALAKALYEELGPDYAGKDIYISPSDPDLLIEDYEEPLE